MKRALCLFSIIGRFRDDCAEQKTLPFWNIPVVTFVVFVAAFFRLSEMF
jgi:hypothetical protein